MRILYFYSWQHFNTGSPKMLATMLEMVDRERHFPLFLATGDGPLVGELEARGVEILRGRVTELTVGRPFHGSRRTAAAALWLRRNRIDLLHVNEFGWNLDLVVGAWLARIPVILHVHVPLRVHRKNLHRFAATRVLFVSEAHRAETAGLHYIADRSLVLPNAIDVQRFESGRDIRADLGLPADALVVSTVAQIASRKAIDVLLDVAEALIPRWPSLHFLVAGPPGKGEEEYARWQIERAGRPPHAGRVHFLGSRSDIPDLLASSDIFFLPSRHETYGLVVAEAMAASVPIVASDVGGIPEVVPSAAVGTLVPVDDTAGFVRALQALLASPEQRDSVGRAGRASLDGRFDRATFARNLEAIYSGI
ncbi:MAG TPA: glycosyltransferase family 4 protein [Gemmatimonadales bacterium]|nr:glycosyltransferase family 4 protein [Gemmatimonadales bacterium]